MALALVEETDDHQALVAKVRYRVSQYSHVIVFGAYSLALARNKGHAGAGTTLQMCASDDIHGNVENKRIIYMYEHRAALAIRLLSADDFAMASTNRSVNETRGRRNCGEDSHAIEGDGSTAAAAASNAGEPEADADADMSIPVHEEPGEPTAPPPHHADAEMPQQPPAAPLPPPPPLRE